MPKRFYKHRLLLDENMPPRQSLALLNEYFDIKHIKHDLKYPGLEDIYVYELAQKQKRVVLTFNTKDFRRLIGKNSLGVIGLPATWATPKLDTKLTSLLMKHSPAYFKGELRTLGQED